MHNAELFTTQDMRDASAPRFDVRWFSITEAVSTLFRIDVTAVYPGPAADFAAIVGQPARFKTVYNTPDREDGAREWSGIISHIELGRALPEREGLSTYQLTLVPRLWLLTQRRNHRIFQFMSEVDIAVALLKEWNVAHELRLDAAAFKKRKLKVQYGETDYEFLYRLLADVGVSFFFELAAGELKVVLSADPARGTPRPALAFEDEPTRARLFATALRKSERVRPTRVTLRDRDYRKASTYELQASAEASKDPYELFYYPENFNFAAAQASGDTPTADDRGACRTDESEAARRAKIGLDSRRNDASTITFVTNDITIHPGVVQVIEGHPRAEVNATTGFLVVETRLEGDVQGEWSIEAEAVPTAVPYCPRLAPHPRIIGVETATIVGPAGEEIHCDETGRVRVHFH